jgi:protein ImuB
MRLELEGGTDRLDAMTSALDELADRAASRLSAEGHAARTVELVLEGEDGSSYHLPVRFAAPIARPGSITKVLRERLERSRLSVPVTAVDLVVVDAMPLHMYQGELFAREDDAGREEGDAIACLLSCLEGRLGARRVVRADLVPDHRPERAYAYRPASSEKGVAPCHPCLRDPFQGRRPTRLLPRPPPIQVVMHQDGAPRLFSHRGKERPLRGATGPERIETGFWEGREVRRDYWVVFTLDHRRHWIFRDLSTEKWFLHGTFD